MRKWLLFVFMLILPPCCIHAQLKEIRAIQQQLPHIKDSGLYVDALNRLGMLFHLKSIDTCFYYAQQAKAIADRQQYTKGQADALRNLGVVHLLKRNTSLALKYFNSCLPIFKSLHDTADECHALMSIGNTFATEKRFKQCYAYLTAAYNLGKTLKNDSVQSLVIVNLANDTTLSADSIHHLLDKATDIAARYRDSRMAIIINVAKAEQLANEGKPVDAFLVMQNAFKMANNLQVEYQIIDEGIKLGDMVLASNDTAGAIVYYKAALKTAEANGYTAMMADAAQRLYKYYNQKGDFANTAMYASLLINYYQTNQQANFQSGIDYLDYTLKEEELENLRSNEKVANYVVIILLVLCVTVIGLLFFMLQSVQVRKKYVELLQERNKIAGNLNAELQNKNEFNNRLISLLAHDFRQPLTALKGMMALLKEPDALSKEEISFLAQRIEASSDTSLEIFDNILAWIKKQVSGFVYEPEKVVVKELFDEAAKTLQHLTDKFDVKIVNNIASNTLMKADKQMLQFINRNLIHNAIKFSPANAVITIKAVTTDTEIIVSVTDEGKGMTEEKLASLFNIFTKSKYNSEKEKGSGVALVICKDFLERMHGRIWAESETDKGTTFFYALPVGLIE